MVAAECVKEFFDVEAKVTRKPGDIFECTEERFEKINGTRHGQLAKIAEKTAPAPVEEPAEVEDFERKFERSEMKRQHKGRRGYRN